MKSHDYMYTFNSARPGSEIFGILLDPKKWWVGLFNETITGSSQKVGDEFTFLAGEGLHFSRQIVSGLIPNQKITWTVTESNLSFLEDPSEWNNTKISFELTKMGDSVKVVFTHEGLLPEIECYDTTYIQESLYQLIETGKGQPNPKDKDGINAALAEKWKLN